MKNTSSISKSSWLIVGIVLFVATLLVLLLFAQQGFSHRIKKISFIRSIETVAPENRQTTEVIIMPESCQITTSQNNKSNKTSDCPMDKETFDRVRDSVANYGVIDKIISNSGQADMADGKQTALTIELQDGTSFTTNLDSKFVQKMAPFFEEIVLLVPAVEQTIPSQ